MLSQWSDAQQHEFLDENVSDKSVGIYGLIADQVKVIEHPL